VVPFSAVGAIWCLYLLGYNTSIVVWVGLIALLGVGAETGVFMLLYLDLAHSKALREGRLRTLADLVSPLYLYAAPRLARRRGTSCENGNNLDDRFDRRNDELGVESTRRAPVSDCLRIDHSCSRVLVLRRRRFPFPERRRR
jgi:hypothetical protein